MPDNYELHEKGEASGRAMAIVAEAAALHRPFFAIGLRMDTKDGIPEAHIVAALAHPHHGCAGRKALIQALRETAELLETVPCASA